MIKNSVIIALIVFIVGVAVCAWVVTEQKQENHRFQEERKELNAKVAKINKLTADENVESFQDTISHEQWNRQFEKYQENGEKRKSIFMASAVAMACSVAVWAWWLILAGARRIIRTVSSVLGKVVRRDPVDTAHRRRRPKFLQTDKTSQKSCEAPEQKMKKSYSDKAEAAGWKQIDTSFEARIKGEAPRSSLAVKNSSSAFESEEDKRIGLLLADRRADDSDQDAGPQSGPDPDGKLQENVFDQCLNTVTRETRTDSNLGPKKRNENRYDNQQLEQQINEFKKMVHGVREGASQKSEPINNALKELTEQVSAIRQYASNQQEGMKKLQDGYDWRIIKTFSLKIIRCIDNLDNRIELFQKQNIDAGQFEEIRDELLFALESSAIEQYEPKIKSDYRGQEKAAEAIRERKKTEDEKLKGKIAEVVRQGYKYMIDHEDSKIVRVAQVKLYG